MRELCDGCAFLDYEAAVNPYDVFAALCRDEGKPMTGVRRIVAVSAIGPPEGIARPVWCRGKKQKEVRKDEQIPPVPSQKLQGDV